MRGSVLVLDGCSVDLDRLRVFRAGQPGAPLSAQEGALLRVLAAAQGVAVGRARLARSLGSGSPRAVDHAVRRLRAKLEERPRTPVHLVTVRGTGYALHPRRLGEAPQSSSDARWLRLSACKVDLSSRLVVSTAGTARLSPLEARLLGYLAARPGQPVDRETLLADVWGYRATRTNTLATTLRRLRKKVCRDPSRPVNLVTRANCTLFVPPAAQAVRRGRGYVVRCRPDDLRQRWVDDPEGAQQTLHDTGARLRGQVDADDVLCSDADGVAVWCARAEVAQALVVAATGAVAVCWGEVVYLPASDLLVGPAAALARALGAAAPPQSVWIEAEAPVLGGPATTSVPLPSLGRVVEVCGSEGDGLLGRASLVREVEAALGPARIVTLLGVAGAGKTRLAEALVGHGDRRALRLELAPLRTLDALVEAVEKALGAAFDPKLDLAGRLAAAGHALSVQGDCVVLLDNAEHLLGPVTEAAEAWARAAPRACWLVTSRRALSLPDEVCVAVPPLPDEVAMLLLARHAGRDHLPWSMDEARGVRSLVQRLDGLPLALVLAGRAVRTLGLDSALERLSAGLELGQGEGRHGSLAAALSTSWTLLTPAAQHLAGSLSAFVGDVPRTLWEAVGGPDVAAVVRELVAHSLLQRTGSGVRMLASVRSFAADRAAAGVVEVHAEQVVLHGEGLASRVDRHGGAAALAALGELAADLDEVVERAGGGVISLGLGARALLARHPVHRWTAGPQVAERTAAWARQEVGPALAADLWHQCGDILGRAGREPEALAAMDHALQVAPDEATVARVRASRALVLMNSGDLDGAEADYLEAISACDATGQPEIAGRSLGNLGLLRTWQGRLDDAGRHYDEALRRLREHGSMAFEAVVLGNQAILDVEARRLLEARAGYERVLPMHRAMGNAMFEGVVTGNLAEIMDQLGDRAGARACYERALALHRLCSDAPSEGIVLVNLGGMLFEGADVAEGGELMKQGADLMATSPPPYLAASAGMVAVVWHERGDLERARQELERAEAVLDRVGSPTIHRFCLGRLAAVVADQGDVVLARQLLQRAEAVDSAEPFGILDAARAHLARACGDDPEPHLESLRRAVAGPGHVRDAIIALRVLGRGTTAPA